MNVYYPGNYDLACFPVSMNDAAPRASFQAVVLGQDPMIQGRVGYQSETMATAMTELRVAGTDEARQEALQSMQEVWNKEIPSAISTQRTSGAGDIVRTSPTDTTNEVREHITHATTHAQMTNAMWRPGAPGRHIASHL